MAWPKLQLIQQAYAELALASYEFDLSADELQDALRRLESQMSVWEVQGIALGYAYGDDISADSGLPAWANEAAFMSLAKRIAAGKGKALARSTLSGVREAYDAMLSRVARDQVQQVQLVAGTPLGAGNGTWRREFTPFVRRPNTDAILTPS